MQKEISRSWFFTQTPQEVWEYLTKSELIEQWLTKTDFKPVPGHKFQFFDKSGKTIHCEVLDVNPFTRLSYSWQFPSRKENGHFESKVLWTLVEKEKGTELQLVHNEFSFLEDYLAHNNGWDYCLQRFQKLINQINEPNTNA